MTLYTIGHSNAEISAFLDLLRRHAIDLLVDTRSQPYSRYSPHFSRESLKLALAEAPFYLAGIEQLIGLAEEYRVAYMCSEADYKHCHRYWLITRTLVGRGIKVQHILHSGESVNSSAAEFEPEQPGLF